MRPGRRASPGRGIGQCRGFAHQNERQEKLIIDPGAGREAVAATMMMRNSLVGVTGRLIGIALRMDSARTFQGRDGRRFLRVDGSCSHQRCQEQAAEKIATPYHGRPFNRSVERCHARHHQVDPGRHPFECDSCALARKTWQGQPQTKWFNPKSTMTAAVFFDRRTQCFGGCRPCCWASWRCL